MAKTKIQIKSIFGDLLFEYEKENNTIKDTVEEAVRQKINLRNSDLSGSDLRNSDLSGSDLRNSDLRYSDLSGSDLRNSDLRNSDLRNSDLSGSNLRNSDLRYSDLSGSDLRNSDLSGSDLRDAKEIPYIPFACPSDGAFIGWKKVSGHLIKLIIPEDARRCSATTNKCRCDKAKVLSITDIVTGSERRHITNYSYAKTTYTVGEMVYPDSFDENRWNECSNGIHFFVNKQEAINY